MDKRNGNADNHTEVNNMTGKVAIEPNLTPIKDYLSGKGYKVESINFNDKSPKYLNSFDAFVVTGLNTDFLGVEDTKTKAMVINADGLSPEDVASRLSILDRNSWI
jgi:hypothetical protein